MRFAINILNSGASLNSFKAVPFVEINRGETFDLFFQLIDKDQGLRYIPATGATLKVEIARLPEAFGTVSNIRQINDYSVRRFASNPFPEDKSIFKLSLTTTETQNMMSSNIRFTLNEGSLIRICLVPQAIKMIPGE